MASKEQRRGWRSHLTWRRQQQLIFKSDNLLDAVAIDDFDAFECAGVILNIDFARFQDHVIQSVKSDLDEVVLGIVGDSDKRQPLRLDLLAETKGSNFNLRLFGL